MITKKYTLKELKELIKEESNEFKPKFGEKVQSSNEKINKDVYQKMNKRLKQYDGMVTKKIRHEVPLDDNKGMTDLEYDNINDIYKKRVKAQLDGYTSESNKKNHDKEEFGNADYTHIDNLDTKSSNFKKNQNTAKEIGLTSRMIDKNDFKKQHQTVYEGKKIRLVFKKTAFISENHLITKIPDELKVEGKTFFVKDKNNTEFLVEWNDKPIITNLTKINEEQNRIKKLFTYKSNESNTPYNGSLVENKKINDILDKTRNLMK